MKMQMELDYEVEVVTKINKEINVELQKLGGTVSLMVDGYFICTINKEGVLELPHCIPENTGLQLDNEGRIKVEYV